MSETIESKPEAQPWQLVDRDGERVEIGAVLTQQSSGPVERNFRMTGGSPPVANSDRLSCRPWVGSKRKESVRLNLRLSR